MSPSKKTLEIFWSKVNKTAPAGCWLWLGSIDKDGYGKIGRKSYRAHRVSWYLSFGNPGNLCVLHRCDVPACVRPDHLFLGTNLDNIKDRHNKKRDAAGAKNGTKTQPDRVAKGERQGLSKLSVSKIQKIRNLILSGVEQKEIAKKYNVNASSISKIHRKITWRHVL